MAYPSENGCKSGVLPNQQSTISINFKRELDETTGYRELATYSNDAPCKSSKVD
ncbi:hypothetical protein H6F88_30790 [Oculatella sp. FACHB-28]|uniref:hypothetical protein n=1 Tax=Cyanophyceae TaxID=3028117 RepID=UPI0016823586|nr:MULTISPECIES: hypothetical protein [Cyanophyceae]MBD1867607.1 hypothetical protein [Cyanobacteria bacterium FACHB-471]MBD2060331.1 hypothetical protein [Oculatella sp. FACHB-28]MBD2070230.1 hypothetical protein [Leptolyngbya sp. FACHB-671]